MKICGAVLVASWQDPEGKRTWGRPGSSQFFWSLECRPSTKCLRILASRSGTPRVEPYRDNPPAAVGGKMIAKQPLAVIVKPFVRKRVTCFYFHPT